MNALAFILDTERTNALTILREVKDPKMSNFNFTWELGKNLVIPHMFWRLNTGRLGLQASIITKMEKILKVEKEVAAPTVEQNNGRCYMCVADIVGKPNYSLANNALNHRVKTKCNKCRGLICKKTSTKTYMPFMFTYRCLGRDLYLYLKNGNIRIILFVLYSRLQPRAPNHGSINSLQRS